MRQESSNNVLLHQNITTHENSISAAIFSQMTSIVLKNQSSFDGSTFLLKENSSPSVKTYKEVDNVIVMHEYFVQTIPADNQHLFYETA